MVLKLACADFSFPMVSHDVALDLIASLQFGGVDVGLFSEGSHVSPSEVLKNIRTAACRLCNGLRDRGLELADIYLTPGTEFETLAVNHPQAHVRSKSRDLFQRILEFAIRCNAIHLTGLPGVSWSEESEEASLGRAAEELKYRVELAQKVGVVFSVEPHLRSIVQTPLTARRLLELCPGLTLTLDYSHFTCIGVLDSEIEPLVEYASHIHARCACKGRLQAPLKMNTINFVDMIRALSLRNYQGYVATEYVWTEWEGCNEVDNLSETIQLRDLLRKLNGQDQIGHDSSRLNS